MNINDVVNYADRLASMKLSSKETTEKQLGISLKHLDKANELFSFYEYHGELPDFLGSTKTEFVIDNNNKENWLIAISFKNSICIDFKSVKEKYPVGERTFASPNNSSPDAANGYETQVNSGTLSFAFNVKSGCLTQMAFESVKPAEDAPAK